MGDSLETWRQRIGCFSFCQRGKSLKWKVPCLHPPSSTGICLRLILFLMTLLAVAGDVETNPGPNNRQQYDHKSDSYNTQEVLDILHNPDWDRVIMEPPVKPRGGQVFLYQFTEESKKDDWRCDQYHFHHDATRKQPKKNPKFKKLFFVIKTSHGKDNRFKKHAYILLEGETNLVLFQYLGDEDVAEDLPHGNSKNKTSTYTRLCPSLIKSIRSMSLKPEEAFQQLNEQAETSSVPDVYRPRSVTHIINTMCRRKVVQPFKRRKGKLTSLTKESKCKSGRTRKVKYKLGEVHVDNGINSANQEISLPSVETICSSTLQTICPNSSGISDLFPEAQETTSRSQNIAAMSSQCRNDRPEEQLVDPIHSQTLASENNVMDQSEAALSNLYTYQSAGPNDPTNMHSVQPPDSSQTPTPEGSPYISSNQTSQCEVQHRQICSSITSSLPESQPNSSTLDGPCFDVQDNSSLMAATSDGIQQSTGSISDKNSDESTTNNQEAVNIEMDYLSTSSVVQRNHRSENHYISNSKGSTVKCQDQHLSQSSSLNARTLSSESSSTDNTVTPCIDSHEGATARSEASVLSDINTESTGQEWNPSTDQLFIDENLLTETIHQLVEIMNTWNSHQRSITAAVDITSTGTSDALKAYPDFDVPSVSQTNTLLPETAVSLITQTGKLWMSEFIYLRQIVSQKDVGKITGIQVSDLFITLLTAILLGAQKTKTTYGEFLETLQNHPSHLQTMEDPCYEVQFDGDYRIGSYTVRGSDIDRLDGNAWLDDSVIHAYLWLLKEQLSQKNKSIFVLECFLANLWEKGNYEEWLYEQHKLKEYTWILMPVCRCSHWFLLAANVTDRTVCVINSKPSDIANFHMINQWRTYMTRRSEVTGEDLSDWLNVSYPLFPQTDGSSCGVFVLMSAEALLEGISPGVMRNCHVTEYRKYIKRRLMTSARPVCSPENQDCDTDDVYLMEVEKEQHLTELEDSVQKKEEESELQSNKELKLQEERLLNVGCTGPRESFNATDTARQTPNETLQEQTGELNCCYDVTVETGEERSAEDQHGNISLEGHAAVPQYSLCEDIPTSRDLTVMSHDTHDLIHNLYMNQKHTFTALTLLCLVNRNLKLSELETPIDGSPCPLNPFLKWSCELSGLQNSTKEDLKKKLISLDQYICIMEDKTVKLRHVNTKKGIFQVLSEYAENYLHTVDLKFIYLYVRMEDEENDPSAILVKKNVKLLASRLAKEILQGNIALTVSHEACGYYSFNILLKKALKEETQNDSLEKLFFSTDRSFGGSLLHWMCFGSNAELFKCFHSMFTDGMKLSCVSSCCVSGNVHILKLICSEFEMSKILDMKQISQKLPVVSYKEKALQLSVDVFETHCLNPLHIACYWGHHSIVACLLEAGMDVNEEVKNGSRLAETGSTAASIAAARGYCEVIKCFTENKANLNLHDNNYDTPLHHACRGGHTGVVTQLGKSCNLSERNVNGDSPLHIACQMGGTENVKILMRKGADINLLNYMNYTPLDIACEKGYLDIVEYIINTHGYPLPYDGSNTPLHKACRGGFSNIVELLLKHEAGRSVTVDDKHPLYFAVYRNLSHIVELILKYSSTEMFLYDGDPFKTVHKSGHTPLTMACQGGHAEIVKLFLEKGADVSVTDRKGDTPLTMACERGNVEIVKLLLEKGTDVSVTDRNGHTPLTMACERGNVEIVKLLLEKGTDVSVTDRNGHTPLTMACERGNVEIVKLLLEKGADVSVTDEDGDTPLTRACERGNVEIVKLLLEKGADVSVTDEDGDTPLTRACERGNVEVVKLLLEKGADVSGTNENGDTPLTMACEEGNVEIVKLLLEKGADVSVTVRNGHTPLSMACERGNVEIVKLLLKKGADVSITDRNDGTPLTMACEEGNVEIVKLLLEKGADVSVTASNDDTPLTMAIRRQDVELVELLLEKGADVSVTDRNGYIPLTMACERGNVEIVKLLLKKGADVSVTHENGDTPLTMACEEGYVEIVKLLLEKGADVSVTDRNGYTTLTIACRRENVEIVKLLLEKGADVSVTDGKGYTPLTMACERGNVEIVKLLLKKGADVSVTHENGDTPLTMACEEGYVEIVKLLLEKGADVSVTDRNGYTTLTIACRRENVEIVKLLLEKGADVSVTDGKGYTPLTMACERGNVEIVKLLLEKGADVSVTDRNGYTTLTIACRRENVEIVKLLLEKGADVSVTHENGDTPLTMACEEGYVEIVKLLLEKGADVSVTDRNGYTTLTIACRRENVEIVKLLLEKGADVSVTHGNGDTPLTMACERGNVEIVKLLLEEGADVSVTYINIACRGKRHVENHLVVSSLLKHSCKENISLLADIHWTVSGYGMREQNRVHKECDDNLMDLVSVFVKLDPTSVFSSIYIPDSNTLLETIVSHGHMSVFQHVVKQLSTFQLSPEQCYSLLECAVILGDGHICRQIIQLLCNGNNLVDIDEILVKALSNHSYYIFQMITNIYKGSNKGKCISEAYSQGSPFILDTVMRDVKRCVERNKYNLQTKAVNMKCLDIMMETDLSHYETSSVYQMLFSACVLGHQDAVKHIIYETPNHKEAVQSVFPLVCRYGYTSIVDYLIEFGVDVNVTCSQGKSPLHNVCRLGHMDIVVKLLESGSDFNFRDEEGKTPLYTACYHRNFDIAELLISRGAQTASSQWPSPLHLVCKTDSVNTLKLMLEDTSTSVNVQDSNGNTPLHVSVKYGKISAVEILLKKHANVMITDREEITILEKAFKSGNFKIVELFLRHNTNLFARSNTTNMLVTVLYKRQSLFQHVCEFIPQQNFSDADDDGNTLLHHACKAGFHDCVLILLKRGCNKSLVNKQGETALHTAVELTCTNIVQVLLMFECDCCVKNNESETPLIIACGNGSHEIVTMLLQSGSQVNEADAAFMTPLHHAAKCGHTEIVQTLVNHGADTESDDSNGDKPLHLACDSENLDTVRFLIEKTPDINVQGHKGRTPLHRAVSRGFIKIVQYLLHQGAVSLPNKFNNTPLYTACVEGRLEIMKLLLKHGDKLVITGLNGYFYVIICCIRQHDHILKYLISNGATLFPKAIFCPTPFSVSSWGSFMDEYERNTNEINLISGFEGKNPLKLLLDRNSLDLVEYLLAEEIKKTNCSVENENEMEREGNQLDHFESMPVEMTSESVDILLKICEKGNLNIAKSFLSLSQINAAEMRRVIIERTPGENDDTSDDNCSEMQEWVQHKEGDLIEVIDETETVAEKAPPIIIACRANHKDIASLLVAFASGHLKDVNNYHVYEHESPLHLAYDLGLTEVVNCLLLENIDTTVTNTYGYTIFHKACELGDINTVKVLFTSATGANTFNKLWSAKTTNDEMSLHIVIRKGHSEILKFFLNKGVDITPVTSEENNAMHIACSYDKNKICRILLDKLPKLAYAYNKQGLRPFGTAARRGNYQCLKLFGDCRDDSLKTFFRNQLLEYVSYLLSTNNIQMVMIMSKLVLFPDLRDKCGNTVFHICARYGKFVIMKYFEKKYKHYFAKLTNNCGDSPLHIAVWHGHIDAVKILIRISDINSINNHGDSPLHFAAFNSHAEIVDLLLASGANGMATNIYGDTPLHTAVCAGMNICWNEANSAQHIYEIPIQNTMQTIQSLFRHYTLDHASSVLTILDTGSPSKMKTGISQRDKMHYNVLSTLNSAGKSPLLLACEYGNERVVETLLKCFCLEQCDNEITKYLINIQDKSTGSTSLHMASRRNFIKAVSVLLEHGANTFIQDHDGNTPVVVACDAGHLEIIKLMLPYTNISANVDEDRGTIFHAVCRSGNTILLDLILDYVQTAKQSLNCNNSAEATPNDLYTLLNTADNEQRLPLHISCMEGNIGCVKLLLKHKLRINSSDQFGRTPLHYASRSNCVDGVCLLLHQDVCVSAVDMYGMTPLHYACLNGSVEMADKLVAAVADLHIRDISGSTPLDMCDEDNKTILTRSYRYNRKRVMASPVIAETPKIPRLGDLQESK